MKMWEKSAPKVVEGASTNVFCVEVEKFIQRLKSQELPTRNMSIFSSNPHSVDAHKRVTDCMKRIYQIMQEGPKSELLKQDIGNHKPQ